MQFLRFARAQLIRVVLAAFIMMPPGAAQAQLDHTSNYEGLGLFLCGADWDGMRSCADREPPLSNNDIGALASEFQRLAAISAYEDEIAEADLIENGFFRLCEADPARCLGWIQQLGRTGSLDGDVDGVLDSADDCPGTSTPISRAQTILLAQGVALLELNDVLIEVFKLLIQGANGTLGSSERASIGESMVPLFFDLLSIANKKADGRYLFGGKLDTRPPFKVTGSFGDLDGPIVTYQGSNEPLELAIGLSGEMKPISVPSGRAFFGDLDLDGNFPDAPYGINLFEFIKAARRVFLADDLNLIRDALVTFQEANAAQFAVVRRDNNETFAATKRVYPTRERSEVDAAGCSQAQFCSAIGIERKRDRKVCSASDYLNDEPLRRSPRDCRVKKSNRIKQCVSISAKEKAR